jgi:hypothetical protein
MMLSDKYLWLVPELTPVHETYKLVSFQELVTLLAGRKKFENFYGDSQHPTILTAMTDVLWTVQTGLDRTVHHLSMWLKQTWNGTGTVTGSWNEASSYALWTRVSSGTGQRYLSDSITVRFD